MLNVAEAVMRVFHRLGDYQHKQRNRMKFLIKSLGWDGWRAAYEAAYAEVLAEGGARAALRSRRAAGGDGARLAAPATRRHSARSPRARRRHPSTGPGIVPNVRPRLPVGASRYSRWLQHQRAPAEAGRASRPSPSTVPLGDFTGEQMRVLADLSLAYGDGSMRVTAEQDLVFRWVPRRRRRDAVRAARGRRPRRCPTPARSPTSTSCPGAESCRLAVTQSRGLGKLLGDHLRERPDLVDAAPDVHIKISGCPNGCGQHHIAGIGFQGSVRKVAGRPVPQYFVMVGGDAGRDGARFGRLAAKIPARRGPEALERLLALYTQERTDGETATAFFGRVDSPASRRSLADLERLTPEDAMPEDFIDLGEDAEFAPEVLDGECSA